MADDGKRSQSVDRSVVVFAKLWGERESEGERGVNYSGFAEAWRISSGPQFLANVSHKTPNLEPKRCTNSALKVACDRAIEMPRYRAILTPPKSMRPSDFDTTQKHATERL